MSNELSIQLHGVLRLKMLFYIIFFHFITSNNLSMMA